MSETTTTTNPLQRQGCPDDCNLDHPIAVFARRQRVSRTTVYRWKDMGLPVLQTLIGPRINCQQGGEFLRHKPPAKRGRSVRNG
jgi:hypothetical protein